MTKVENFLNTLGERCNLRKVESILLVLITTID